MKILVAVDQYDYSRHAVDEVAKLAANTWANITLFGVQPKRAVGTRRAAELKIVQATDGPLPEALFTLHREFLSYFDGRECPYAPANAHEKLTEVHKGVFELAEGSGAARKKLTIRMRIGNPANEILSEAKEEESDLIVLGCDHTNASGWENAASVPRKIAGSALCSVLVVKKKRDVQRIVCCLDHDRISQPSLEMINQMVTLHKAPLTIVGLTDHQALKTEVEKKMDKILRYYHARQIDPWIELVEISALESFIARETRWGLLALWMGKQSILTKALPRSKVNQLIKGGDASVLILR